MSALIVSIAGPAGVGKDTLISELVARGLGVRITAWTTRPMRSKEENGREYHFVSEGEFEELRNREHIFDESLLNGFRYGTPLRVIRQIIHNGETGFFHLSTAACLKLRGAIAPCACVFLLPENKVQLISQMSDRGMTAEAIERRLAMDPVDWERLLEFDLLIMSKPGDASYAADRIEAWLRERSDNG